MKFELLQKKYTVAGFSHWAGEYICDGGDRDESWSWYKDGDRNLIGYPHATVVFMVDYECNSKTGEWVGLHVSVPLIGDSGGARNMRFNYGISKRGTFFKNTSTSGMPADFAATSESYGADNSKALDAFARGFYKAAVAAAG